MKFNSCVLTALIISTLISFYECFPSNPTDPSGPVVETKLGKVRGFVRAIHGGKQVNHFVGIPFLNHPLVNYD